MFGAFRLLLALLVAVSHANIRLSGLNPGVIAVVCFYLISGYVMTGLIRKHYADCSKVRFFYADRAIRLFPQYLAISLITMAWFCLSGTNTNYLRHTPSFSDIYNNLIVIPLNYYMFNYSDQFTLIPPAWSLGAEIQFYLAMPWLLIFRLRVCAFILAGLFYVAAAWGLLNTDTFGYRLLPGVLMYFLLGSALYDTRDSLRKSLIIGGGVCVSAVAFSVLLNQYQHFNLQYNKETLLGLSIGVLCIVFLGRFSQSRIDNFFGDLSYGVFLNHFLIQWALIGVPQDMTSLLLYLAISLVLSATTQRLFEKPVLRFRQKYRNKTELEKNN